MSTPGIGDPYWYEWSIGLINIVEMLNPDSGIECVILQSEKHETIDDVVVIYEYGKKQLCYQIKHSIDVSSKNNLTFSKLFERESGTDESQESGKSLLRGIADGWKEESKRISSELIYPILYTNRSAGPRKTNRKIVNGTGEYKALPLEEFYREIKFIINNIEKVDENTFAGKEDLGHQWEEFILEAGLEGDEAVRFIRNFEIKVLAPTLEETEEIIINRITENFGCNRELAKKLFIKLAAQLRIWATSRRETERIISENVYTILSENNNEIIGNHDILPPVPFFSSRKKFCKTILKELKDGANPIVFIEGAPGTGKTSIASYLYKIDKAIRIRFYAFKPIKPDEPTYNADTTLTEPKALWGDLLAQLRVYFKGELGKYKVPIINDFCSTSDLKKQVLRLAEILHKKTKERIGICIDGIDHAARAGNDVSCLEDLMLPEEVPDGVCFLIIGQPSSIYSRYPIWLRDENSYVKKLLVPELGEEDIQQLLEDKKIKVIDSSSQAKILAKKIKEKTQGNNLSIVFTIEEISKIKTISEIYEFIDKKGIGQDISRYYDKIWSYAIRELASRGIGIPFPAQTISSILVLHSGYVNCSNISNAMKQYNLLEGDWQYVMELLYPLIKVDAGGNYYIFHNDFNIYLTGQVYRNDVNYKAVSLSFAKYYWLTEECIRERVRYGIDMIINSRDNKMLAEVFNTKFVIECLAEGVSYNKIYKYAQYALESAIISRNLVTLYSVGQAFSTINQHEQYFSYYDKKYTPNEKKEELNKIHIWELEKWPLSNKNLNDYYNVICFIKEILENENTDYLSRAKYIYDLWYGMYNPGSFIEAIQQEMNSVVEQVIDYDLIEQIFERWGRVSAIFQHDHFLINNFKEEAHNKKIFKLYLKYNDSYLAYIYENKQYDIWILAIGKGGFSLQCIEKQLKVYLDFDNSGILMKSMEKLANIGTSKYIKLIAMLNLLSSKNNEYRNVGKKLFSKLKINSMKYLIEDEINEVTAWSICYACFNFDKHVYEIIGASNNYIEADKLDKDFDCVNALFRMAILVGKMCGHISESKQIHGISDKDFETILNDFFKIRNGFRSYNYNNIAEIITEAFISSSKCLTITKMAIMDKQLEAFLFSMPFERYSKNIVLDYFVSISKYDIIKSFIDELYDKNGYRILNNADSKESHKNWRRYGILVDKKLMESVDSQLKWEVVNYVDHKEYAVYQILEWYREIIKYDKCLWNEFGLQLYKQSLIASKIGSNRASGKVEEEFAKAAYNNGIDSYWDLLNINRDIYFDIELMYLVLFEAIEKCNNEEEAYIIWIWAVGILSWYNKDDRQGFNAIIKTLDNKALKCAWKRIIGKIKARFPLYMSFYQSELQDGDIYTSKYALEKNNMLEDYKKNITAMSDETILDTINKIEKSNYQIWDYLCEAIKVFKSRCSIRKNMNDIIAIVKKRDERYSWEQTGIRTVIQLLIDDFTEEDLWNLIDGFNLYFENYSDKPSFSLNNNIHYVCIYGFKKFLPERLKEGFNIALNTQRLWVYGAGNMNVSYNLGKAVDLSLPKPNDICELVFNIILIQLGSHNVHRMNMAIYAMHELYLTDIRVPAMIANSWNYFNEYQKKQLLLLSERWAIEADKRFAPISELLLSEYYKIDRLDVKMQIFYILNSYYDRVGQEKIAFITDADSINYDLEKDKNGYYNPSGPMKSRLNWLSTLIDDDITDIKRLYKVNDYNDNDKYPKRPGDYIIYTDSNEDIIMKVLYGEFKKGRWGSKVIELAQALLNNDDAMVITEPPQNTMNISVWDCEKEIKKYIENKNVKDILNVSKKIIYDGLNDQEYLLASKLYIPYGYNEEEFTIYYSKSVINIFNLGKKCKLLPNINLKSILIFEDYYEPVFDKVEESLFRYSRGMSLYFNGNCEIYPSKYLKKLFNWNPDKYNPLVWKTEDGKVAMRFELVSNPIREAIQERYNRQPVLFRWICNKEILDKTLNKLNISLKENWSFE